ncbi:hypothetical protein HPB49_000719 [Dermacentor silvarum]|uniref:Uncharacterized protein n=1 Tax=Dermacentor silvarum TaxID=543639 RepID=A0ACB8D976_DERSI|nr:hypothetical protein HPB49_000719 [Dermacentor silvarum]
MLMRPRISFRKKMPRRLTLEERYEIVSLGKLLSQREISRKLNRPLKTVDRILRAFSQENRLEDAPHQQRPRRTTEEEDALIIAAAVNDPFTTAKKIKEELGLHLSLSAIRRRLNAAGLRSHVAARKPLLTSEHRRKRLDFVRQHEHWSAEDWQKVIFSDESTFTSCWNQRLRVWRVRGSR